MAEIPGFVWAAVGVFISVVSLFLGFLKPVEFSAFFKIMMVVGVGMFVYGYIFKIRFRQKSLQNDMEARRQQNFQQRGETEVEIDIDDYRNNPQLRQNALKSGYPSGSSANHTQQYSHYGTPRNVPQQQKTHAQQQSHSTQAHEQHHPKPEFKAHGFCPSCGTPLLKEHKYCPICGARV